MTPVIVPEEIEEGAVGNWFFDDGARVRANDLICEVMVEKTINEVHSPIEGILRIRAPTEAVVHKGDTLAVIEAA